MIKSLILSLNLIASLVLLMQINNIPNLNEVNKIQIRYIKSGKQFTITNKETIGFFKDLIRNSRNKEGLKCDSTGEILYLSSHQQIFKIYFSTRITGSKFTTDAIAYAINNRATYSLLTYNTGMSIDEIFNKLNKGQ
jgi:hypothetical protein